jgi:acyl-CoA thioesterase
MSIPAEDDEPDEDGRSPAGLSADLDFLGLEFDGDPARSAFTLAPHLARLDGALYGGTAIAVSVAAMEAATGRPTLWLTTQFVGTAERGEVVACTTAVVAGGRRVAQVQVDARVGDRLVFTSLGATAVPRDGGLDGGFRTMPEVPGPDDCDALMIGAARFGDVSGFRLVTEYREVWAGEADSAGEPGAAPAVPRHPVALWGRLTGGRSLTRASLAFLADMVPLAVARAAGKYGAGISLDNSLRFGAATRDDDEWVLLDIEGDMATGGFGHGVVRMWTDDGRLVAVGTQTANMVYLFDADGPPARPERRGGDWTQ